MQWLLLTSLLHFRGWRKKKSEIKSVAEDRARAVIREEFQNLGPIKCVVPGFLVVGGSPA